MPTTSNFGWTTPADTDLVKDGAAAIRTLGNGVDTSFVDLKGGTTGQILAKASGTDLDFNWITNDDGDITAVTAGTGISGGGTTGAVTITNSMATEIDAKGDLVAGTGADTFARIAVGANNTVLTADSSTATGLKYDVPTTLNSLATGTLSGASVALTSISGSYTELILIVKNYRPATDTASFFLRVNNDSGSNRYATGSTGSANYSFNSTGWQISGAQSNLADAPLIVISLNRYADTDNFKVGISQAIANANYQNLNLMYNQTTAITQLNMLPSTGNFTSGSYYLYGVK